MVELTSSLLRTFTHTFQNVPPKQAWRQARHVHGVPTVELGIMEGGSSRHSPRSTEAANTTSVVTMVTSKLSRTLEKAARLNERPGAWLGAHERAPGAT